MQLIIFDWDGTLFPLASETYLPQTNHTAMYIEVLNSVLSLALALGHVAIVSTSTQGHVSSCFARLPLSTRTLLARCELRVVPRAHLFLASRCKEPSFLSLASPLYVAAAFPAPRVSSSSCSLGHIVLVGDQPEDLAPAAALMRLLPGVSVSTWGVDSSQPVDAELLRICNILADLLCKALLSRPSINENITNR
jgi:hypothetical protein